MYDNNTYTMDYALLNIYRNKALLENNIDPATVNEIYNVPVGHDLKVLGKDSIKNYIYTYLLIFGLIILVASLSYRLNASAWGHRAASTGFMGILGSKIYRLGTLMYGNPIKFTTAIKLLRQK